MTGRAYGELIVTPLEGRRWHVERADPQVLIDGWLIREASCRCVRPCQHCGHQLACRGAKLVIDAINGRFIYLIGRYHRELDAYEGQRPD